MKLLQINVSANWGSHGKIAEAIGNIALNKGWKSMIAFGRMHSESQSELLRIGNEIDIKIHGLGTRLFDYNGLMSKTATKDFIKKAEEFNPDIVHLHNIHGYYINYPLLFAWLKKTEIPVVWTLHDCWPWTGHCAYYTYSGCLKWQRSCYNCPSLASYPKSLYDGARRNYNLKKDSFIGHKNLTLVPVSNWLKWDIEKSFLKDYRIKVIHNGVDINTFKPSYNVVRKRDELNIGDRKLLLGVASIWEKRKGFDEFIKLSKLLPQEYHIVLVGLSDNQISKLPAGITGIKRTNNVNELVDLYSAADLFINPTLEDNFPTTNLEALACGTPVITYDTGGSPEAIDSKSGLVIDYKNVGDLAKSIIYSIENKIFSSNDCRKRAVCFFDKDNAYKSYFSLYNNILCN